MAKGGARPGGSAAGEYSAPSLRDGRVELGQVAEPIASVLGSDFLARDLLAAYFDKPRHWPSLNPAAEFTREERAAVVAAAARYARGMPLQYAVGKANFRALTLAVDERVLIPRPETELLVDLVLQRAPEGGTAVDVGTGSGAIAISLATEGRFDRVIAADISRDALDVARANARAALANVEVVEGDLLSFAHPPRAERAGRAPTARGARGPRTFSAVVSNPPYIAFDEAPALPPSVRDWEPAVALFSPREGLAITERLVAQAAALLQDEGLLALEVDARRASLVVEMMACDPRFGSVSVERDLTGRERFVLGIRRRRDTHD